MKTHVKALVVGGGAVGTSIAYHLAKAGWQDVMLLERDELTSGSTWHAAGLLPYFNMSFATTHIHDYSIKYYKTLEAETGLNAGFSVVGNLRMAQTDARMDEYGKYNGGELLDKILDIARIGLAAEMLGGCLEAFERTVAYLKERQQFGVPIGTFQALQHRAAHMYSELELGQAAVDAALVGFDSGQGDQCAMASAAKALANECFQLISDEAVQMHGGMGVTDELDIGLFLKRSRVCNQLLGNTHWHRLRYADRAGF